ncbi:MAG: hypothetical protein DRH70_09695, partial [Candidatus Coatesbacteria bacterium]
MRNLLVVVVQAFVVLALLCSCASARDVLLKADADYSWHDVFFVDSKTGFVVGDGGRMMRTGDGG